jgi:hypothetical protein
MTLHLVLAVIDTGSAAALGFVAGGVLLIAVGLVLLARPRS